MIFQVFSAPKYADKYENKGAFVRILISSLHVHQFQLLSFRSESRLQDAWNISNSMRNPILRKIP